jgi:hypothetical protein
MTIRSYKNKASEDIAYGISSKRARSCFLWINKEAREVEIVDYHS